MDGLLVVDKPAGPTSHDVVARARRALGERRIGHTGTLDPAATGVLCLVLGRATRLAQFLSASDKTYQAVVRFGFATDTADAQGRALGAAMPDAAMPPREAIESALDPFRGTYLQQPPAFSAKKIGGKRSHEIARAQARNRTPPAPAAPALLSVPAPASVTAHSIEIVGAGTDTVTLSIRCSAGFYVRSLAHDLGERLGVGAHLASLRRTRSGDFSVDQAITLDALERDAARAAAAVIPLAEVLPGLPAFTLTTEGVRRAINGCALGPRDSVTGQHLAPAEQPLVRLLDPEGALVGIARPASGAGLLHPAVVLM
jgi:tRNA pseudouridine55 synthase